MSRNGSTAGPFVILAVVFIVLARCVYWVHDSARSAPIHPQTGYRDGRNRYGSHDKKDHPCAELGIARASSYFKVWQLPTEGSCRMRIIRGYPVPDPTCTPGGINKTVTLEVLTDVSWRTRCVRNAETTQSEKHVVYRWYSVPRPFGSNNGTNQVCELDHLVPLELGGADGLGNIWPQCGPDGVSLDARYFKAKDKVEGYLAREVRAGRIPLDKAQRAIAEDWTQFLPNVGSAQQQQ